MAISYSLELVTAQPVDDVARTFAEAAHALRALDPATGADQLLGDGALTAHGTWVRVVTRKPIPWGDPSIGGRTFTPTVSVAFRLGKEHDAGAQQDDMVRLSLAVLARVPGDAVLHLDSEQVWLVRQDGGLDLSTAADIWPPHRLAAVPAPYRRHDHAFVDDED
ncbi:SitI3 family protein [Kitasatospora sp. NPDC054939]